MARAMLGELVRDNGGRVSLLNHSRTSSSSSGKSSTPIGAIVGGAVGGVASLLLLSLLACFCLRKRMRQVRDPHHPRHKLIGSYGLVGSGESRTSSEKESRRSGGMGSNNADLLGGVHAARTTNGVSPGYAEEQMYEPSPFFATTAAAGVAGAATTNTSGSHSRNHSYTNESSSNEKTATPSGFAPNPARGSDSTNSHGFEWNPAIWGGGSSSRPASLASEPHGPHAAASSTGGATLGHPAAPPSAYHGTASETALVGAAVNRNSSTRKAPIPSAPTTPQAPSRGQFESPESGLQNTGTGPDVSGRATRFVLHEDAGAMDETLTNEEQM